MIADYSAIQLFEPCPGGVILAPPRLPEGSVDSGSQPRLSQRHDGAMADVAAVFTTRTEFAASVRPAFGPVPFSIARTGRLTEGGVRIHLVGEISN
jgi:hypothetical protein